MKVYVSYCEILLCDVSCIITYLCGGFEHLICDPKDIEILSVNVVKRNDQYRFFSLFEKRLTGSGTCVFVKFSLLRNFCKTGGF